MPINNKNNSLEIIKDKLDSHEFAFQEAMWEDMEKKLDAQETALTKWKNIYYILPIVALLIVDFYFLTGNTNQPSHPPTTVAIPILKQEEANNSHKENDAITPKRGVIHPAKETPNAIIDLSELQAKNNKKSGGYKNETSKNVHQQDRRPEEVSRGELVRNNTSSVINLQKQLNLQKTDMLATPSNGEDTALGNLTYYSITSTIACPANTNLSSEKKEELLSITPQVRYKNTYKHFGISGGLALSKDGNPDKPLKRTGYIGIKYKTQLRNRWGLEIGLKYGHTTMANPISIQYGDTILDPLRENSFSFQASVNYIMFIESNISVRYRFPNIHSVIKLGLNPTYIYNYHEMGYTSTRNNYYVEPPDNITIKNFIKEHDYGLNKYYLGISLGYEYQLSPSFSLQTSVTKNITDLSNDYFLRDKTYHSNTIFRLGMTYWVR